MLSTDAGVMSECGNGKKKESGANLLNHLFGCVSTDDCRSNSPTGQ